MFCPQCGTQAETTIKYCKQCGTQLSHIRNVMTQIGAPANWNDIAKQEYFEIRKKNRKSPEVKRLEEIKAGVITTVAGVGASLFLNFFMVAVAAKESDPGEIMILTRIWLCGLVPTFIGLAMIFNGLFISPKIVALKREEEANESTPRTPQTNALPSVNEPVALPPMPHHHDYSVIEHTTARLADKVPVPIVRDTN